MIIHQFKTIKLETIKNNYRQHRFGNMAADGIIMSICAKTNIWNFYELQC